MEKKEHLAGFLCGLRRTGTLVLTPAPGRCSSFHTQVCGSQSWQCDVPTGNHCCRLEGGQEAPCPTPTSDPPLYPSGTDYFHCCRCCRCLAVLSRSYSVTALVFYFQSKGRFHLSTTSWWFLSIRSGEGQVQGQGQQRWLAEERVNCSLLCPHFLLSPGISSSKIYLGLKTAPLQGLHQLWLRWHGQSPAVLFIREGTLDVSAALSHLSTILCRIPSHKPHQSPTELFELSLSTLRILLCLT